MAVDVQEIRAKYPLAEVAARLTGQEVKVGSGGKADICCPLPSHPGEDKNPSMTLYPAPGGYACGGCGAHGDVIQFVKDLQGCDFPSAVAWLEGKPVDKSRFHPPTRQEGVVRRAARGGVEMDRTPRDRVLAALDAAWGYYSFGMLHDRAVEWLRAERGIDVDALEKLTGKAVVGRTPFNQYDTDRRDKFLARMRAKGFTDEELIDAGLAYRVDEPDGKNPDLLRSRFRRRWIMPIKNDTGRVIGLVGRFDGEPTGRTSRYLNTANTVTFNKSRDLYSPDTYAVANGVEYPRAVVCEGPLDALAVAATAAQTGNNGRLAPMAVGGAHMTAGQAETVANVSPRAPVLVGDSDDAGQQVNIIAARRLRDIGRESLIVDLPDRSDGSKHDPASWLAEVGAGGLDALTLRVGDWLKDGHLKPYHSGSVLGLAAWCVTDPTWSGERRLESALAAGRKLSADGRVRYGQAAVAAIGRHTTTHTISVWKAFDLGADDDLVREVCRSGQELPPDAAATYAEGAAGALAASGVEIDVDQLVRKIRKTDCRGSDLDDLLDRPVVGPTT